MSIKTKGEIKLTFEKGDKPTQQECANMIESSVGCIGKLIGANMNITTDQLITLSGGTKFMITDILITNASTSITTASNGQFWTGINHTGSKHFSTQNGGNDFAQLVTPEDFGNTQAFFFARLLFKTIGASLYFSLGTPQGAPATCDIYIFGFPIL